MPVLHAILNVPIQRHARVRAHRMRFPSTDTCLMRRKHHQPGAQARMARALPARLILGVYASFALPGHIPARDDRERSTMPLR